MIKFCPNRHSEVEESEFSMATFIQQTSSLCTSTPHGHIQSTVYLYKLGTSKFQNNDASAEVSEFSQFGLWARNALGHFHPLLWDQLDKVCVQYIAKKALQVTVTNCLLCFINPCS